MNIVVSPTQQNIIERDIDRSANILDGTFAEKEANQILAVCRHFSFRELESLNCLYLGAIDNIKTECLALNFREVTILNIDNPELETNQKFGDRGNIKYICCEDGNLAVDDFSFDVVICDRFCSNVDNPDELMYEIYRVLKNDGFCHFSAYNKTSLCERNYSIPFLSWLPGWAAEKLLKLSGHEEKYNYRLLTLPKLRKLIDNFWRHDYVGLIRQNPLAFQAQDTISPNQGQLKANGRFLKYIYPFLPLWTWVLTKKK